MNFDVDELDLIEQVLQSQEIVYIDSCQGDEDPSGFVVDDDDITVGQYKVMVTRILQKIHGVDEAPELADCPDCGKEGESRGHYGCQYPTDDPNIEDLEDPMERER